MDSENINKLSQYFKNKISKLEITSLILSGVDEEEFRVLAEGLERDVAELERYQMQLQRYLKEQHQQLCFLQKLKEQSSQMVNQLKHMLDNVPQNLPKREVKNNLDLNSNPNAVQECQKPQGTVEAVQPNRCQYLQFLTVDEFDSIPKYMKGRLTYDRINSTIRELDNVFIEKYKVLKQRKTSLSDVNRKRYEAFKLQENKNTKGHLFIVEKDVTDLSSLKIDSAMRSIITILRHFGIIHEIRGDGYVRFATY